MNRLGRECNGWVVSFLCSVPDDMVMALLSKRLGQLDIMTRGYVLHGFPANRTQAELLSESGHKPNRLAGNRKAFPLHLYYKKFRLLICLIYLLSVLLALINLLTYSIIVRNIHSSYFHFINHLFLFNRLLISILYAIHSFFVPIARGIPR